MSEPETVESVVGEAERRSITPENQFRRSIYGLPVNVIVSIGQKKLSVAELLQLKPDTIIPLTAKIEDPIELVVEDRVPEYRTDRRQQNIEAQLIASSQV